MGLHAALMQPLLQFKRLWRENVYTRFVFLFLIIAVLVFVIGNTFLFQATKSSRLDWKRQTDVFVLRLLEEGGEGPISALARFVETKRQLYILDSDYWVVDSDLKVLASSTSNTMPNFYSADNEVISHESKVVTLPQEPEKFIYFITYQNQARELVGIGQFNKYPLYLVTSQKTRQTTLSRMIDQFYNWSVVFFILAGLLFIFISISFLRSRARMAQELAQLLTINKAQETARMHLLKEIGHDLGSPLAGLKSLIENIQDSADRIDRATQNKIYQLCQSEIQYVQNLIDNILFIADLRSEKYNKSVGPVSILRLLQKEIEISRAAQVVDRNIQIHFTLPEGLASEALVVYGDELLLQRTIKNLLINAKKFAQKEIEIAISVQNKKIQIEIKDDGKGFSKEILTIYEKHFQALDRSADGKELGLSGLGLMIVAQIAHLHRGDFSISNSLKGGAICRLSLPTAPSE